MNQELMDTMAARLQTTVIPPYSFTSQKKGNTLPSYWVAVRNARTGYTKLMPRAKAQRYINNRPSDWHIMNPLPEFKDKWELTK